MYGCWKRKSRVNNNNKDDCCKVKVREERKGERRKGPAELELEWKEEEKREGERRKKEEEVEGKFCRVVVAIRAGERRDVRWWVCLCPHPPLDELNGVKKVMMEWGQTDK